MPLSGGGLGVIGDFFGFELFLSLLRLVLLGRNSKGSLDWGEGDVEVEVNCEFPSFSDILTLVVSMELSSEIAAFLSLQESLQESWETLSCSEKELSGVDVAALAANI